MEECIFCKIASGEIQGLRIYENNETLAFMDIAKDVDGHILVIPKKHCKNILDCDSETLSAVMNTVKRVSNHLTENCGYDGINLLNASDESAGQSVNHFHIHIIPRKSNDGIDAWPKFEGAKEELQTVFDKVKSLLILTYVGSELSGFTRVPSSAYSARSSSDLMINGFSSVPSPCIQFPIS